MNGDNATPISLEEATGEAAGDARGRCERSISEIREDFSNTVQEIKKKFGLLLELRDRRIKDLEEKLAQEKQEKPKPRLLVVDESESTAQIVNRYLEGRRVEVVHVAGDQARDRLGSEDYDAVMLEAANVIEPDVDGLALCRRLCEAGKGDRVIVMSSRPGDAVKNSVEQAGAVFLRKPFQREQVAQLMRKILLEGEK